jgi:hypothetical protein
MSERTEVDGSYTVTLSDEQLSSIGFELDRIRDRMIKDKEPAPDPVVIVAGNYPLYTDKIPDEWVHLNHEIESSRYAKIVVYRPRAWEMAEDGTIILHDGTLGSHDNEFESEFTIEISPDQYVDYRSISAEEMSDGTVPAESVDDEKQIATIELDRTVSDQRIEALLNGLHTIDQITTESNDDGDYEVIHTPRGPSLDGLGFDDSLTKIRDWINSEYNSNISVYLNDNHLRMTNGSADYYLDIRPGPRKISLKGKRYGRTIDVRCGTTKRSLMNKLSEVF